MVGHALFYHIVSFANSLSVNNVFKICNVFKIHEVLGIGRSAMPDLRDAGPAGLNILSASEAATRLASGEITSEALVADCLERIAARDPEIGAWAHLDPEAALTQARERDGEERRGPLHGVPVGVKDVLDTADLPTEYGSAIHAGHQPQADAACVSALRRAGAVILGKTTTTEFACPIPVGVRNPHDFGRSPGVSSSGSAAAVADFMTPLALGTQTGGSVILPAAFCGLVGYKASLDGLDRGGIRHLRPSLDTLGGFAREVGDIALLRAAMTGVGAAPEMSAPPRIGVCRTFNWDQASPETAAALESAAETLAGAGAEVNDVELPAAFTGIEDAFRVVSSVEGFRAMEWEIAEHLDALNGWAREGVEAAAGWDDDDYEDALAHAAACRAALGGLFATRDVLLTPSTAGEASDDLTGVSNSAFNRVWTMMHGPCVTIPAYAGPNGLPVGVQIVGPPRADDQTLAVAAWIAARLPFNLRD